MENAVAELNGGKHHLFEIGPNDFLLDGNPFIIRCGEIHFPRVPREYWRHRLKMCHALGLNAVCVYLFWNYHEWEEGTYDWNGQADAAEFCRLAQEEGLWVVLRPGPYSCAEWEMGGLPWWLLQRDGIRLRTTDPNFLRPATDYLHEVGRVLGGQQITSGGPILMVQVENEYGSFGDDASYMGALRQALIDGGFNVPLFACNPSGDLKNGHRPDLFQVVNFGAGAARQAFETLRAYQPTGPLMNGEYYPAWFDMWGRKHRTGASEPIVSDLEYMLKNRHSFSVYMAHGGTSFGLWAGADRPFSPDTTSYDYDAPISEAGWVTPKFKAVRKVMVQHLEAGESLPEPPLPNAVIEIPPFLLRESAPLFDNLPDPIWDRSPGTMETYRQSRGMTVYRTELPPGPVSTLTAKAVHDFAWAFLDGKPIGVMDRRKGRFKFEVPHRANPARLEILVYAMGRVNFGDGVFDRKGLHAPVSLDSVELQNWEIFPLPLDDRMLESLQYGSADSTGPAFWRGSFELTNVGDTFLDLRTWRKGVVWINGHALGRFWNIGPTQTLYVPGPWLRKGSNEVVVLDLLGPVEPKLAGLTEPILDELRPGLDFSRPDRASGHFEATNPVISGSFAREGSRQEVTFPEPKSGRYLCLEALSSADGTSAAIADIDAFDPLGTPLPRTAWKILWVSSEETNYVSGEAENAIDGQTSTFWHSEAGASALAPPHRLAVDLGETLSLGGIRYLPPAGEARQGSRIQDYCIYLSDVPFGLSSVP
jgi:beta-galactosidase